MVFSPPTKSAELLVVVFPARKDNCYYEQISCSVSFGIGDSSPSWLSSPLETSGGKPFTLSLGSVGAFSLFLRRTVIVVRLAIRLLDSFE